MDEKRAASSADQGSIKSAFRKQAERAVLAILRNVLFYCRVATYATVDGWLCVCVCVWCCVWCGVV